MKSREIVLNSVETGKGKAAKRQNVKAKPECKTAAGILLCRARCERVAAAQKWHNSVIACRSESWRIANYGRGSSAGISEET